MTADSTFLTDDEVRRLTGRRYANAQFKRLALIGIPAVPDADGRPIVLRLAAEARMGAPAERKRTGPDWSAMNAPHPKA